MDHESLRTASTYLNNLLLARGLSRNGDPIDFVKPSRESRAQIINLVHDLILREDRDKEQQETIAYTLRQLRSEDARKTREIERLTAKSEDSARVAAQAQAAERAAHADVKKVEKAMKALQDQTAKLKMTLAQVKTQCTNDVRKRDLELTRLKTHLQGQQRGNRVGMSAPSMTVRKTVAESSARELGDPEYSLRQETTEFLTQLSQSLSDENDNLISLIRNALGTLRDLLGLPANVRRHPDSAVGSMGSEEEINKHKTGAGNMLHTLPTSYDTLTADMESSLSVLKTVLTNPNFVSVEEVEVREEEIARLREGWEHMEGRLRDVLFMMQGWLKRMNTGESINIEDLRMGMGIVSPDRTQNGETRADVPDQSMLDSEASSIRLASIDGPSAITLSPPVRRSSSATGSPKRKRDAIEPPEFFDLRPHPSKSAPVSAPKSRPEHEDGETARLHEDDDESVELEIPRMTIAEKLSAAQEEAEVAAAAKASRRAPMPAGLDGSVEKMAATQDEDTLGKMPSPMGKRTKIRGRAKRRKSTLSPEELETLICANEGLL